MAQAIRKIVSYRPIRGAVFCPSRYFLKGFVTWGTLARLFGRKTKRESVET